MTVMKKQRKSSRKAMFNRKTVKHHQQLHSYIADNKEQTKKQQKQSNAQSMVKSAGRGQ